MSRDIDKEKKDQRKAECKALRDARKRGVLKTVMSTSNIKEAAKLEHMTPADLKQTLRSYGVKHEKGQIWAEAVKEYMDAGMPHQYEMRVSTLEEFVDKPRYLNFEEKNLQMEFKNLQMEFKLEQAIKARNSDLETKLEQKLEEAVREGYDEAELIVPDPAHPNRTIKYNIPL